MRSLEHLDEKNHHLLGQAALPLSKPLLLKGSKYCLKISRKTAKSLMITIRILMLIN